MGSVLWRYEQTIPEIPVLVGMFSLLGHMKNQRSWDGIMQIAFKKPWECGQGNWVRGAESLESFLCRGFGCPGWWNIWGQSWVHREAFMATSLCLVAEGLCRVFVCIWGRWEDYQTIDLGALCIFTTSEGIVDLKLQFGWMSKTIDNWPRRGGMRSMVILLFTICKREAISIPPSSHPGVPECVWYNIKCILTALRIIQGNNQNQTCNNQLV